MTSPDTDPSDLSAPLPVLPVCATCAHLYIAHRRGRCRGTNDTGPRCDCTRFTEPATVTSLYRPDFDATEDQPA